MGGGRSGDCGQGFRARARLRAFSRAQLALTNPGHVLGGWWGLSQVFRLRTPDFQDFVVDSLVSLR